MKMMMMLLLQIMMIMMIYATSAAASSGLEEACQKKSTNVNLCTELLSPYASQFADNDQYKMGHAAISATVAQVQTMKAFMVKKTTEPETSEEDKATLTECLTLVAKSDDSLRTAAQDYDKMYTVANTGDQNNDSVIKSIVSARTDLIAGVDLLKKRNKNSKLIGETVLQADRSVKACFMAHAFLSKQFILH